MLILNRTGYNLVMGIEKSIFKPLTPHIEDFCRFLFKEFALQSRYALANEPLTDQAIFISLHSHYFPLA